MSLESHRNNLAISTIVVVFSRVCFKGTWGTDFERGAPTDTDPIRGALQ
jgi:hypothetical protein